MDTCECEFEEKAIKFCKATKEEEMAVITIDGKCTAKLINSKLMEVTNTSGLSDALQLPFCVGSCRKLGQLFCRVDISFYFSVRKRKKFYQACGRLFKGKFELKPFSDLVSVDDS